MADDLLNPKSLGSVFGWRVTVEELCLEAEAYKYTRLLKLIRNRQSNSPPSSLQKTFDFSKLPLELFDKITDITRRSVIMETRSRYPYKRPDPCVCIFAGDKAKMSRIAKRLAKYYPEVQDLRYLRTAQCRSLMKELDLQGRASCILSVLDTTFEGCQGGWTDHWKKIFHNLGTPDLEIAKEIEPILAGVVLLLRETGHKVSTFDPPLTIHDDIHERMDPCKKGSYTISPSPEQHALSTVRYEGYPLDFHEAWKGPIPGWLHKKYNRSGLLPLIRKAQYLLRPIPDTCQGDMFAALLQRTPSAAEQAQDSTSGYWKITYC